MSAVLTDSTRIRTRLGALHVRVGGTGPTTVFWPSMFVDGHTWDRLLPFLSGRRMVVVDAPGQGRSAPLTRASTIRGAADAAGDLLSGLANDGLIPAASGVDWVGNAFGGHVGYELAVRPGVLRSLAAISAPLEPITAAQRRQIRMLAPVLRTLGVVGPVRSAVLSAMLTDASVSDPAIRSVVEASLRRPSRGSMTLALRSFILDRVDVTGLLPRIPIPCLFVASDDRGDWSPEDAERAASAAPQARAVTIAGARTLVPLEQPGELADLLETFWASLPR